MLVSLAVILAPSTTHLIVFGLVAWLVLVIIILPFILAAFHYRDNPPAVPPYQRPLVPISWPFRASQALAHEPPLPCPSPFNNSRRTLPCHTHLLQFGYAECP